MKPRFKKSKTQVMDMTKIRLNSSVDLESQFRVQKLELIVERNDREELIKIAFRQSKEERLEMVEEVKASIFERMEKVTGG